MARLARTSGRQAQGQAMSPVRATRSRSQTPQPGHQQEDKNIYNPPNKRARKAREEEIALPPVDEDVEMEDEMMEDPSASRASAEHLAMERGSVHSGVSLRTAMTTFSQEELRDMDPRVMLDSLPSLTSAAEKLCDLLLPTEKNPHSVVRREIRAEGSSANKFFKKRVSAFELYRNDFGSTDYIQPAIAIRALLGVTRIEDVPSGNWRPDAILHRVNIAQMLRTVLAADVETDAFDIETGDLDGLELLETYFPTAIAGATFHESAFRLQLSLLVQLCIARLVTNMGVATYSPHNIVTDSFYDNDSDEAGRFKHMDVLHLTDLPQQEQTDYLNTFMGVVDTIKAAIDTHPNSPINAVQELRARFPWTAFVDRVGEYCNERIVELDAEMRSAGGMQTIVENLDREVQRRVSIREADAKRESLSRPGGTPRKALSGMAALKRGMRSRGSNAAAPSTSAAAKADAAPVADADEMQRSEARDRATTAETAALSAALPAADAAVEEPHIAPADDYNFGDADHDVSERAFDGFPASAKAMLDGFGQQQREKATKAKANFVDRQKGAQRVDFDEEALTQEIPRQSATAQPARASSSARGASSQQPRPSAAAGSSAVRKSAQKRRREEETEEEPDDFDPTQDTGFQTDVRNNKAASLERRRMANPPAAAARRTSPPPPAPQQQQQARPQPQTQKSGAGFFSSFLPQQQQQQQQQQPAASTSAAAVALREARSTSPRRNPGSSIPPPQPRRDPDSNEAMTDSDRLQLAKTQARYTTLASGPHKTQSRVPWTADEELALIELIGEHGCAWRTIKTADRDMGEDARLGGRTAEHCREKARNLTFMFLKSRTSLPTNFENVALPKAQLDKLAALGIHVHQDRRRAPAGGYW